MFSFIIYYERHSELNTSLFQETDCTLIKIATAKNRSKQYIIFHKISIMNYHILTISEINYFVINTYCNKSIMNTK